VKEFKKNVGLLIFFDFFKLILISRKMKKCYSITATARFLHFW